MVRSEIRASSFGTKLIEWPCIMIHETTGAVILFRNSRDGVVLSKGTTSSLVGDAWIAQQPANYRYFAEAVVLKND